VTQPCVSCQCRQLGFYADMHFHVFFHNIVTYCHSLTSHYIWSGHSEKVCRGPIVRFNLNPLLRTHSKFQPFEMYPMSRKLSLGHEGSLGSKTHTEVPTPAAGREHEQGPSMPLYLKCHFEIKKTGYLYGHLWNRDVKSVFGYVCDLCSSCNHVRIQTV
jgi:hypothetical protein